jgi:hypothetical protein
MAFISLLYLFCAANVDIDLGTFQLDGQPPINLTATAQRLLNSLSRGVRAANYTLGRTKRTSFHLFATNRTEFCHFHPGDTTSTVLWGRGVFYSNTSTPTPQTRGSVYFIPRGWPHAFGHVGEPTVVTVAWSPPYHADYIIPTTGCIALPPRKRGKLGLGERGA